MKNVCIGMSECVTKGKEVLCSMKQETSGVVRVCMYIVEK